MPALSPTMTSGNIGSWHKKEGDEITAGDVLVEIETDKAQMDFEFQEDGFIAKILVDAGSKDIDVNKVSIYLTLVGTLFNFFENKEDVEKFANFTLEDAADGEGEATPASTPKEEASNEPKAQAQETSSSASGSAPKATQGSDDRIFASPLAKKLAEEKGINLAEIKGTGPNNRIVKSDVESYTPATKAPQPQATPVAAPTSAPTTSAPTPASAPGSTGSYTDIPLTNIRKVIATRLTESKQQIPHYYLTVEANVDSVLKLRQHLNSKSDDKYKLSVNDFITKASALAMKDVPEVNSSWHGDFIRQYNTADISIATATPTGLITPIVKSVEGKGLSSISNEIKSLAARARNNELKPHEYQGGSFTISNLGMFGVNNFTAIVNPPQSCILAVGATQSRIVVDATAEKGFKEASILTVTLSCDHRVVDGAVGAKWLKAFKGYLENPLTMLL
ncbi:pyruvate dehydrogenase [Neoconidiobolus thromboides FSU 785]|nr:pyruvate dehydrogenase [Neoconidiobolus thromboides FSU 785]